MALTVREKISAQLLSLVDGVTGVTAVRPKRMHWTDQVTANLTAIVKQEGMTIEDLGTLLVCQQNYSIRLAVIESDDAATSYETETNRVLAAIVAALDGDIDAGDNADYEGIALVSTEPIDADDIVGETLYITVTFRTLRSDMENNQR